MLVRVHFRVGKLGPHISLRSFRMLVRVGCDEMFVRVTVSDTYKQKPAQHRPLLSPPPRGADPYKHLTSKHPEERPRRRGPKIISQLRMFGRQNVGPVILGKLGRHMFVRVGCATRNVCTGQVGLTRTNIREEDTYKHSLARDHCGKCLYGSAFFVSASPPPRQLCMPRP